QGKLVPQDPSDEPASVLLERIRAEKKTKLGKKYVESYIYKGDDNCYYEKVGKNEPVKLEDLPFDIPDSWSWARLKDIVYNNGQKTPTSDFSYIDIGSIDNIHQKLSSVENIVSADKAPSRARKIIKYGDILYSTVRPYLHNMCIIDKRFSKEAIASTGFAVLSCEEGMVNKYLFYYMLSPIFDQYANSTENSKGVAYPAINDDRLYKTLVPIPPQSEQKRIWKNIEVIFQSIEKGEI
ncbi:MAG: restriction endonuclease subunit S, partial [Alphaproteobacteria bacterium]|nr:restriction endonuclease subunit S [Alphaproteobacteria bacterium]